MSTSPSIGKMRAQLIPLLKRLPCLILFYLFWKCCHNTCQNTGDKRWSNKLERRRDDGVERDRWPWPSLTFSDSAWQSISAQTGVIAQLFSASVSQEFYDSCQVHPVCLFSDFTTEEPRAWSRRCLWGARKLALYLACFCLQCGMRSGCCCLCVLSSAGVSACCFCLFFCPPAQVCGTMSHQWWVCRETTKQVPPQSFLLCWGKIRFAGL